MDNAKKTRLKKIALDVRRGIIESIYCAKSGHPGGSLSIADTLTYLYFEQMNVDPSNPKADERDRFVLSKGHCAPGLYSVLAQKGFFSVEELKTLRKPGSFLQGHPDMKGTPGVDMSSGSLGQGISAACGMALSLKLRNSDAKVYAILGDGELQEGQVWEASMFAGFYNLTNLCIIIDYNGLQIGGKLSEVMDPAPIDEKFKAFGFEVVTCDAHDFDSLEQAFSNFGKVNKPLCIIQNSVKGKGVSFMENNAGWHGSAPNEEQYNLAMKELDEIGGTL